MSQDGEARHHIFVGPAPPPIPEPPFLQVVTTSEGQVSKEMEQDRSVIFSREGSRKSR